MPALIANIKFNKPCLKLEGKEERDKQRGKQTDERSAVQDWACFPQCFHQPLCCLPVHQSAPEPGKRSWPRQQRLRLKILCCFKHFYADGVTGRFREQ